MTDDPSPLTDDPSPPDEQRPPGMPEQVDPRLPDGAISWTFSCAACGKWAMRVLATARDDPLARETDVVLRSAGWVTAETGIGKIGTAFSELIGGTVDRPSVLDSIGAGDAAALHAVDREMVPLWCRDCAAVYCADHWETRAIYEPDSGFFDEMRGRCPNGHERRLWD
jgi:hypothetical protein